MSTNSQVTRIGCYAVISEEKKILLCRLCDGLAHHGKWTLPGGGLDFGETLEQATEREVFEETGLRVSVKSMLNHSSHVGNHIDKVMHHFPFMFSVDIVGGELTYEVNGSTDKVQWIDFDSISDENSVDIVHRAVGILKDSNN